MKFDIYRRKPSYGVLVGRAGAKQFVRGSANKTEELLSERYMVVHRFLLIYVCIWYVPKCLSTEFFER